MTTEKMELKSVWLQCLNESFEEAEKNNQPEKVVRASDLQSRAKISNRFPSICNAMKSIFENERDEERGVYNSSTYTIKYKLPRLKPIVVNNSAKKSELARSVDKSDNSSPFLIVNKQYISEPSANEVRSYLEEWKALDNYVSQESALNKLFSKTYPKNVFLDEILIKVSSLNDFYSTNIKYPYLVAKHIYNLKIDEKLNAKDLNIVNKIADVKIGDEKSRYFFSFATKYCSHHKPDIYPIYDDYVKRMLKFFNKAYRFCDHIENNFKDCSSFKATLISFQQCFGLGRFSLKEIDRYLWLLGKKSFPKYKKK